MTYVVTIFSSLKMDKVELRDCLKIQFSTPKSFKWHTGYTDDADLHRFF